YSNTNISAIRKVQEVCCISGFKAYYNEYQDDREDFNRSIIYSLVIQKNKFNICGQNITREEVDYSDRVYCVSVPSKMIIVRRNGVVSICGNTEHAVMCAGKKEDERETFRRLIEDIYPSGIVSIVSDTWDLWKVLREIAPSLRSEIEA